MSIKLNAAPAQRVQPVNVSQAKERISFAKVGSQSLANGTSAKNAVLAVTKAPPSLKGLKKVPAPMPPVERIPPSRDTIILSEDPRSELERIKLSFARTCGSTDILPAKARFMPGRATDWLYSGKFLRSSMNGKVYQSIWTRATNRNIEYYSESFYRNGQLERIDYKIHPSMKV